MRILLNKLHYILGVSIGSKLIFSLVVFNFLNISFESFSVLAVLPFIFNLNSGKSNFSVLSGFFDGLPSDKVTLYLGLTILIVFTFKFIFQIYYAFFTSQVSTRFNENLTNLLFSKYIDRSYDFHLNNNSSKLVQNLTSEVQSAQTFFQEVVISLSELVLLIIFSAYLLLNYFGLTVLLLSFYLSLSLIMIRISKFKVGELGKERESVEGHKIKFIQQSFSLIKHIIISGKRKFFVHNFNLISEKSSRNNRKILFTMSLPRYILEYSLILILSIIAVYYLLWKNDSAGLFEILLTFSLAAYKMIPSINKLNNSLHVLKYFEVTLEKIYQDINFQIPVEKTTKSSDLDTVGNIGVLNLRNISFSRQGTYKNIFSNLNLGIPLNSFIGIAGESGIGKSTLLDLIMGLFDPNTGSILINEVSIKEDIKKWRGKIAYVPQEVIIFDDSLINNVAIGFDETEIDIERVKQVLIDSNLNEFIDSLEKGIYTNLGERGSKISGGQKQRIGLARALYLQPEILLLDEVTSALDEKNENLLIESLANFKNNITAVIVSHRESILKLCDEVYEISDGTIKLRNG